jgi:NADPH:quinone reductase-like Zn-dependent oxidoreductase
MPSNQAAWLSAKSAKPLEVKSAPYTPPGENEIVVKNGAVAINPLDWFKQAAGNMMFSWIKYPFVMGSDLAGEVVEVGKGVTHFKVGDRVLGHAVGMDQRSNKSSEGAFQEYTVIRTSLTSPIPSFMSYENACVLPLCLSTAACGMFMKDFLALPYPSVPPQPNGKTLLVWGGSTSVGSNAIQLAVASGHEVIATASPKNFDFVRRLGAAEVYDYRSPTVVRDIIAAFKIRESAGAFAIGNGSLKACIEIVAASKGRKFVAQASINLPDEIPSSAMGWMSAGLSIGMSSMSLTVKSKLKRVDSKFIFGSDLMANEVGRVIYEDFLPGALAEGKYIAAPEPQVIGKGLEHIQEGMDLHKNGVSAKKVVISL